MHSHLMHRHPHLQAAHKSPSHHIAIPPALSCAPAPTSPSARCSQTCHCWLPSTGHQRSAGLLKGWFVPLQAAQDSNREAGQPGETKYSSASDSAQAWRQGCRSKYRMAMRVIPTPHCMDRASNCTGCSHGRSCSAIPLDGYPPHHTQHTYQRRTSASRPTHIQACVVQPMYTRVKQHHAKTCGNVSHPCISNHPAASSLTYVGGLLMQHTYKSWLQQPRGRSCASCK